MSWVAVSPSAACTASLHSAARSDGEAVPSSPGTFTTSLRLMRRIMVSQADLARPLPDVFLIEGGAVHLSPLRRSLRDEFPVHRSDRDVHLVLDDFGRSGNKLHKPKKEA